MFGIELRCAPVSTCVATGIALCVGFGLGISLGLCAVSLVKNHDARGSEGVRDTGRGVGAGGSAGWMGASNPSFLLGSGTGSGCNESLTLATALSRRSRTDLSKINSIAAVRCGVSPDEELRMILDSKLPSIKGFSLDWKS